MNDHMALLWRNYCAAQDAYVSAQRDLDLAASAYNRDKLNPELGENLYCAHMRRDAIRECANDATRRLDGRNGESWPA